MSSQNRRRKTINDFLKRDKSPKAPAKKMNVDPSPMSIQVATDNAGKVLISFGRPIQEMIMPTNDAQRFVNLIRSRLEIAFLEEPEYAI